MNFFTAFSNEKSPPVLKKLYGGRWRMTRTLLLSDGTEMAEDTFPPRGTQFAYECSSEEKELVLAAGINPDDFHLIDMGTGGDREEIEIISVWETLTGTLVDADKPKVDYDLNGLKRITHTLIGLPDIDMSTYDFVVGESEYATSGPVLAQFKDETDDAATKITAVYIQPGVISKGKGGGPASLPNTIKHSWTTWMLDATSEAVGAGNTIPGLVTDIDDENVEGFVAKRFTSLALANGTTPVGASLKTYYDNLDITINGTVRIGVYANTPFLIQVPPTTGTKKVAVTVHLVAEPDAPAPVAYNMDGVSVSVLAKTTTHNFLGSETVGGMTTNVYTDRITVDHTTLRGYVIDSSDNNGSNFTYSYASAMDADGDSIVGEAYNSSIIRSITLSGTSTALGATGIYRRTVDPVITSAAGVTYFRVAEWAIPV
jgi:hypothetical protein